MKTEDIIGLTHYVVAGLQKGGQLKGYDFNDEDVLQEGYVAALEAAKRYKPEDGKPSTFFVPRIRGAILDYIAKERNQGMASKRKNICVVSLNVDDADHENDAELGEGDGQDTLMDSLTYADSITGNIPAPFRDADGKVLASEIASAVAAMDEPYRSTLERHYGLNGEDARTFTEVHQTYGVQPGTSYKRLTTALSKLKSALNVR